MTTEQNRLRNPYTAGRVIDLPDKFFGRKDILQFVITELQSSRQNVLVLSGQRRIGKTSILLQLQRRLAADAFLPVYFDLMDRANKPLKQVLFELALVVAAEADMPPVTADNFDDQGHYFRRVFLPELYKVLDHHRRPVFLFDEFDVLDASVEQSLPSEAASMVFFPYLRELIEQEDRLGFVFVVGRKAEELSINVKATFKSAHFQRVSVLDWQSARNLIYTAQEQGTLQFDPAAVDRILELTAGHPYFTQLFCYQIWNESRKDTSSAIPTIKVSMVEDLISQVLEVGKHALEWIWDGLPPAEKVIFATIAEATDEQGVVSKEELVDILQRHGIRILTGQLELAPDTLVEWELLRKIDDGYGFFIELMRRWVRLNKPPLRVKDELDRIVPLADQLYQTGNTFYQRGDLKSAQEQLHQALLQNPNHLKARLLLGQVLIEQQDLEAAIQELEEAYLYDERAARHYLIRALLAQGEELQRHDQENAALKIYERVLGIAPHEHVAREHRKAIWIARGDRASAGGDMDQALEAYQESGVEEKVAEVKTLRRKQMLWVIEAKAQEYEQKREWTQAIQTYQRLRDLDPEEERWYTALIRVLTTAAQSYEQQRDLEQAVRVYQRLEELEPESGWRNAAIQVITDVARQYEQQGEWEQATQKYQSLVALDPKNEEWSSAVERIQAEQELSRHYTEGLGAFHQQNWPQAIDSMIKVVSYRADYKDAAKRLAQAVRRQRAKESPGIDWRLVLQKRYMVLLVLLVITFLWLILQWWVL